MNKMVRRVILGFKRRLIKKLKRRSPFERLKARQYYRKRKSLLRLQRRRYIKRNRIFLKSRKLFKRSKPHWLIKKKHKAPKPKYRKPKKPHIKKFYSPKRIKHYKAKVHRPPRR